MHIYVKVLFNKFNKYFHTIPQKSIIFFLFIVVLNYTLFFVRITFKSIFLEILFGRHCRIAKMGNCGVSHSGRHEDKAKGNKSTIKRGYDMVESNK